MKYKLAVLMFVLGILVGTGIKAVRASAVAPSKKFEYQLADALTVKGLMKDLSVMGAQGWEAVTQVGTTGAVLMKREVNQ